MKQSHICPKPCWLSHCFWKNILLTVEVKVQLLGSCPFCYICCDDVIKCWFCVTWCALVTWLCSCGSDAVTVLCYPLITSCRRPCINHTVINQLKSNHQNIQQYWHFKKKYRYRTRYRYWPCIHLISDWYQNIQVSDRQCTFASYLENKINILVVLLVKFLFFLVTY